MTTAQNLFLLLQDEYTFPNACFALGITPAEGSKILHGGRKPQKQKKQKQKEVKKSYIRCIFRHQCKFCSDESCNLRTHEAD